MSELPAGWTRTTLGRLGRYTNGRAFKQSEWRAAGRPIIRIQNLTGTSDAYNYFDGAVDDRYVVRAGDLLVSWAATLGAYIWRGREGVLNQHIFKVESEIDVQFHKYLIDFVLGDLMRHAHGSGMVHITRGKFDALPVALPPLDEQRRIVALLEDHLSRLKVARSTLALARVRLDALESAMQWSLTNCDAPTVRLDDLTTTMDYGTNAKASATSPPGGVPVLRMGNLQRGRIEYRSYKYLPVDHPDLPRLLLADGDLLFNRTNSAELVGKAAVHRDQGRPITFASYLIRCQFSSRTIPEWVALVLNSPLGRRYIRGVVSQQVGQANVNGSKLRAMRVPLPALSLQQKSIARYNELRDESRRLDQLLSDETTKAASLRQSLLQAAFSGRLTSG